MIRLDAYVIERCRVYVVLHERLCMCSLGMVE